MIYSYVPSQVKCSVFGIEIENFSETNIVDIERENSVTTFTKAMDGSHTAFIDKYGSYKVSFHVNQTSESNTWLHLLFKLYQKVGVELKIPISVEEKMDSGGTRFTAFDCFFDTEPPTNFASDVGVKVWTFVCHNGTYTQEGTVETNDMVETLSSIIRLIELSDSFGINLNNFSDKLSSVVSNTTDKLKNFI